MFLLSNRESKPIQSGPSSKVTANVTTKHINQSMPQVQVIKTYSPSDYKSSPNNKENFEKDTELQQLKLEKYDLETKYKTENQELQLKVNALEEHLAKSQQETEEIQRKLQRAIGKNRKNIGLNLSKLIQTCLNMSKLVQTCPNLSKLVKTWWGNFTNYFLICPIIK